MCLRLFSTGDHPNPILVLLSTVDNSAMGKTNSIFSSVKRLIIIEKNEGQRQNYNITLYSLILIVHVVDFSLYLRFKVF